ncbi:MULTISPECIES: site-specific integrase, partial [unclassified Fusobacterium]|uniref:site-specific integrase n=1 Tax=unclassified Fusobacterium TaxID=2648384 RepID=UPI001B8B0F50
MKNENGAGSVYKLSGKRRKPWIARITVGYDKEGKQLRKTIGTYATKREGQEALLKYNAKPMLFNDITFKELMNMWWNTKKESYTEKSKSLWESRLNQLKELYDYRIIDITLLQLQNLFDTTFKGKSFAYKSALKSGLNMIFNHALINDLIESNKVQFIELGKNKKVIQRKIFQDWEIRKLWCVYEEKDVHYKIHNTVTGILLLIYTGLRINELLNLKNEDIDLDTASFK